SVAVHQGGRMFTHPSPTFIALGALAIAGCTSSSYRSGQSASVQFGTVVNAREVVLDSNADSGAIVGGTLGLVMGSGRRSGVQARNAILGAGVGAAIAGAADGDRRGMQYTVSLADGSETRIVTDQREIRTDDCVAIERAGDTANIRRVARNYCDDATMRAVGAVERHARQDADACQAAKEEYVDATTPESANTARRM